MRNFDEPACKRLEDAVTALEARCLLEIVLRITPRSDSYRDAALLWAWIGGLLTLVVALFAPHDVHPATVVPNVVVVALLAGWLGHGRIGARLLTTRRRRAEATLRGARACFMAQSVSGTRGRTGVLVYASELEDIVVVLPDGGAEGAAPEAEWAAVIESGAPGRPLAARLEAVLSALAALGERHLPAAPGADNPDELPNQPIIG